MASSDRDSYPPIPPDGADILGALEELDQRIDAWSSAMDEATQRLQRLFDAAAAGQLMSQAKVEAQAQADVVARQQAELKKAADKPEADPTKSTGEPSQPQAARKTHGIRPGEPDSKPKPAPAQPDEDEALLASLDTETAMKVRIRRRLCENTKSVREILDELRSGK